MKPTLQSQETHFFPFRWTCFTKHGSLRGTPGDFRWPSPFSPHLRHVTSPPLDDMDVACLRTRSNRHCFTWRSLLSDISTCWSNKQEPCQCQCILKYSSYFPAFAWQASFGSGCFRTLWKAGTERTLRYKARKAVGQRLHASHHDVACGQATIKNPRVLVPRGAWSSSVLGLQHQANTSYKVRQFLTWQGGDAASTLLCKVTEVRTANASECLWDIEFVSTTCASEMSTNKAVQFVYSHIAYHTTVLLVSEWWTFHESEKACSKCKNCLLILILQCRVALVGIEISSAEKAQGFFKPDQPQTKAQHGES